MRGVWAIARQTLAQALRMRMAVVFILLLAVFLTAVFGVEGDNTLTGRLRTFLQYSLLATQILLTVMTILVGVNAVAADVRQKQLFLISTKPVARWQYVLGRWLGVVLLDAILLAVALAVIYAGAYYLRGQKAQSADDRVAVETEIFAARQRANPDPPAGLDEAVARRLKDLRDRDILAGVLAPLLAETRGDREGALELLRQKIRKEEIARRETLAPRQGLRRTFSNVRVAARGARATGRVVRRDTWQVQRQDGGKPLPVVRVMIETEPGFLGRLLANGPVRVGGVTGTVAWRGPEQFTAGFVGVAAERPEVAALSEGDEVALVVEPLVQLHYRVDVAVAAGPDDEDSGAVRPDVLKGQLWFETPSGDYQYPPGRPMHDDPVRTAKTLVVPARVVDSESHKTVAYYVNRSTRQRLGIPVDVGVQLPRDEMYLLYRRGGFDGNFVRTGLLSLAQLAFVAALSVCAGTFLSFPVGALVCFAALPFAFLGEYLADATKLPTHPGSQRGVDVIIGHYILAAMRLLVPDLSGESAGAYMVDGKYFGWAALGMALLVTAVLRTGVVLALGWLIFQKRELARVQI